MVPTFATDDGDRACPLLDLDLALDRGCDGGSELAALMVGRFANGSKLPPGLADRDMRGQAMSFIPPLSPWNEQQGMLSSTLFLSLRHATEHLHG
jgi:hypothetical protein